MCSHCSTLKLSWSWAVGPALCVVFLFIFTFLVLGSWFDSWLLFWLWIFFVVVLCTLYHCVKFWCLSPGLCFDFLFYFGMSTFASCVFLPGVPYCLITCVYILPQSPGDVLTWWSAHVSMSCLVSDSFPCLAPRRFFYFRFLIQQ